ncbi:type II secretion system protein GspJ [Marinomonas piezotolerans]|uniref:Type II secretion system protein J n=1 Tax=Marinomonas piezotolerans TaxID=2213058 RepID=A0A370UA07_9GAMM|nr:type II secretion system minor pseudopilin GspJ [Marinomonas piezotolerans]RDL44610.1 type II secretion system protein GspJ [Marinomonas piezotolerans]
MRHRQLGFTLIELLVVIGILGFVGAAAFAMLGSSLRLQGSVQTNTQHIEQLTRAMNWLQSDAEQFVNRPIRDELGEPEPALEVSGQGFSLTHLGWNNVLGAQRSTLQRVEYRIVDNHLRRRFWRVLDRDQDSAPVDQMLLNVEQFKVEVLSATGWHQQWPLETNFLPGESAAEDAPLALRVELTTETFGAVTRVFELPSVDQVSLLGASES